MCGLVLVRHGGPWGGLSGGSIEPLLELGCHTFSCCCGEAAGCVFPVAAWSVAGALEMEMAAVIIPQAKLG